MRLDVGKLKTKQQNNNNTCRSGGRILRKGSKDCSIG